jgi:hypothetical protein
MPKNDRDEPTSGPNLAQRRITARRRRPRSRRQRQRWRGWITVALPFVMPLAAKLIGALIIALITGAW